MDKKVEVIGGQDTYRALCRACYIEESSRRETDLEMNDNENCVRCDRHFAKEELAPGDMPLRVSRAQ
ncbi:unnamed protein product [Strongylus vulgaris]|uniref:Thymidine kinase n=1 Tax=Strongylus vulgaris TaxID=40348 RepID=A0A3P7II87_STRVU|nr:unnamed protein product [Strongylus vulgaris]